MALRPGKEVSMADSIFRKESLQKISSPEELHDYIKVSSPSVWLIIGAAAVLLIGLLVWAAFGTVDSSVTLSGVAGEGLVRCYAADVSGLQPGDKVNLGGLEGSVKSVSAAPMSREDAAADCGGDPYTVYRLGLSDWNYLVEIELPGAEAGFVQVKVLTEQIHPLSFIFG